MSRAVYEFPSAAYTGSTSAVVGSVRSEGMKFASVVIAVSSGPGSVNYTIDLLPLDPQTGIVADAQSVSDGGSGTINPGGTATPWAGEVTALPLHGVEYQVVFQVPSGGATASFTVILED